MRGKMRRFAPEKSDLVGRVYRAGTWIRADALEIGGPRGAALTARSGFREAPAPRAAVAMAGMATAMTNLHAHSAVRHLRRSCEAICTSRDLRGRNLVVHRPGVAKTAATTNMTVTLGLMALGVVAAVGCGRGTT
jgi:hypothetical protein